MENEISRFGADELFFDIKNPRLVEFNITANSSEEYIINILWSQMAVNEIVMSILAHGFFENEPMYAVVEKGKKIIVEGNRRLAAIKSILNPALIDRGGMGKYIPKIEEKKEELFRQLSSELPVIVLDDREQAWRYIGFKHVNGAAKWDSFPKAQYIAQVHHDFNIPLEGIAEQIGDANKTTIKLYQGLMVLQQADRQTSFKSSDVYSNRIYFSHVYTAMMYEGFQKYLGVDLTSCNSNPVPAEKLGQLEEVMYWLLGSKSRKIKPVIKSQNPDLRYLNEVISNREAVEVLKSTNDLALAHDTSQDGSNVLYKSLVDAKANIQKALSKLSYYKGDKDALEIAMKVADSADMAFKNMKTKYNEILGLDNQSKRTID